MTSIDPKLRQAFTGISGILVTPFDDQDRIAPNRLAPIVDRSLGPEIPCVAHPRWRSASATRANAAEDWRRLG